MPRNANLLSPIDLDAGLAVERAMNSIQRLEKQLASAKVELHAYAVGLPATTFHEGLTESSRASVDIARAFIALDMQAHQPGFKVGI